TRYAIENDTPGGFAKAQRLLNKTELGDLQDFIDKVKANMGKYNQELNNMSYKSRITRYQALEKQIDAILQQLYAVDYQTKGEEALKEVYSDSYYQTWFNIDQYKGFHQEFAQINAQVVDELIRYPFNGADFSTRIWKQKDHMLQQLNESITTMLIQGRNPMTLSKDFSKKFETKEFEAYRLLHTEGSFMMGQGTLAAYKEDGVKKYQLLATLDTKTSDICRGKDGDIHDIDKAVVGVTYWPFHNFCRTTDVPYYEDRDSSNDTRVARDPVTSKSYEVPADMKYPEWHKKYIESNPKALAEEKKWKNRFSDKKQYEDFKQKLGAEHLPKSFDEFQNLKYNDIDEYGILKAQAKGMTYYNKAVLNEPDITSKVKQVAETSGMEKLGLEYRIKEKDSFLEKVRKNYNPEGNEYEIKDIVRYTLGSGADSLSEKTLKVIDMFDQEGYNTIKVKNTWGHNSSYNGINTFIKAPSGQVFEIQYHTQESFDLKNGELHKLYEKQRKIADDESEEYLELEDQMIDLSNKLAFPKDIERVKNK
ncbi:MAG: minor capsid protein, partial [Anaerocolumna sp.]